MDATEMPIAAEAPAPRRSDRRHTFPGRQQRINLRLDSSEHHDIATAAARAGMTPTGFCADAALATARGINGPSALAKGGGITRAELASLQRDLFAARTSVVRVGTNLNQAVAALNATGEPPVWLGNAVGRCDRALEQIDAAAAAIDRRLR